MSGKDCFLDTNIIVPFLNGESSITDKVNTLEFIHLPAIVLGELYYGAMKSLHMKKNLERIKILVDRCEVYPISEKTTALYGELKALLSKKGTPIPENDIWIAALAKEYDLSLVTRDKHFKYIPGIEIIVW